MAVKRNGAHRADTIDSFTSIAAFAPSSAASSFLMTQRMALEAARFWARRMHAYADQMEALAACSSPDQFIGAQTRFVERLQDDYAAESAAFTQIWKDGAEREVARAEHAAED